LADLSPELRRQIARGLEVLERGDVVAYPTDTVYGLGARMTSPEGVERVFLAKSRPRSMALPLLVASLAQIEELAARVPPMARRLIEAFLPGALTLILPASESVPDYLRTPEGTIALRIPAHPVPVALIEGSGSAIVGTSANLSGRPNPLTAEEVRSQLGKGVALIIDGGRCSGRESTIVDMTGASPVTVREGAISREAIQRACSEAW